MPAYHPCGQCSKREAWRLTTYPRRCHNSWPRRFTSNYTQLPLVYTAKTTITPNTKHRSPNHKMPPRTVGERTPHPMPLPCLLPSSILDPTCPKLPRPPHCLSRMSCTTSRSPERNSVGRFVFAGPETSSSSLNESIVERIDNMLSRSSWITLCPFFRSLQAAECPTWSCICTHIQGFGFVPNVPVYICSVINSSIILQTPKIENTARWCSYFVSRYLC